MIRRLFIWVLVAMLGSVCVASEIAVLGETPVAEFTLPDGSVLKNAFVWRRNSQGLMIVHDDGQYFLNFSLLPADWKSAYLGEPEPPTDNGVEATGPEVADPYALNPVLKSIPELAPAARKILLTDQSDLGRQAALALALLQSLISNNTDQAKRIQLLIDEMGLEIDAVDLDVLFSECSTCGGDGIVTKPCPDCKGTGKCPKCGGEGERKTGLGDSTIHCTVCRGTGKCALCAGEGEISSRCRACNGRGKRLNKSYCEVTRDQFVLLANALANPAAKQSPIATDAGRVRKVIKELGGLDPSASDRFFSETYDGALDADILAACVLHSLLKGRSDDAERFDMMFRIFFPDNDTYVLGDYLKPCDACKMTGAVAVECPECEGSGKCTRCGGTGERETGFRSTTIYCTTCKGTGKCPKCDGEGEILVRCSKCGGRGRIFERQRSEVKLGILVEKLNGYLKSR
ncbi:hypothetical protein [Pontiella sp.]|uniref:hypothetical protein n=1 Tax=Pontiella sp. TaxID=2837462 RepID=UPI003568D745